MFQMSANKSLKTPTMIDLKFVSISLLFAKCQEVIWLMTRMTLKKKQT